jgi:acyl-CoA synthetase (NDP forming)
MGLINTDPVVKLNASFSPVFPPSGRIGMSSQSGALGLVILGAARRFGLGLSTFVSVGNKADVSVNDLLQYWEDDFQTDIILLYIESFGNPRRFSRIAQRVNRRKPVVVVKAGRTGAGRRAAGSHTAALASSDAAVAAMFQQTGIIRADSLEEMFDLAAALSWQPLPRGPRVGVITNAGGPGILCADACEALGLTVPELSAPARAGLASFLPLQASLVNPVDMIASAGPEHYCKAVEALLNFEELDALVVIYIPAGLADGAAVAQAVLDGVARGRQAGAPHKPVLACWMTEESLRGALQAGGDRVPTYAFPERPAHVLAKALQYVRWRSRPPGQVLNFSDADVARARQICSQALEGRGPGWLTTEETLELLDVMGLRKVPGEIARTPEAAVKAAQRLGFPVTVKLSSTSIIHKTEAGAVFLDVADDDAVRHAFNAICERLSSTNKASAMDGVLVQPMVKGGTEVMIGMTRDSQFGALVAFGLGGTSVEVLADVCLRVAPLTDSDAVDMIHGIRGYRVLAGYRGRPAVDRAALQEALLRLSQLVEAIAEIDEVDLNPILALPDEQGYCIADARIHVNGSG